MHKRNRDSVMGRWLWVGVILAGMTFFGGFAINLFVSPRDVVQLSVRVPVLALAVAYMASLIASGRFTVHWFKSLSPAVIVDSPGLRKPIADIRPIAHTSSDVRTTGFPATVTLNVDSFRVPGFSGPGHDLVEAPADCVEILSPRVAIIYSACHPVSDRVYRGYSAVAHDIALKTPYSAYLPDNGKVIIGILDTRTDEADALGERAFDSVLSAFGTLVGDARDVVRGGVDRKVEALKAASRAIRKKTLGEKAGRALSSSSDRKAESEEYSEVEQGRSN